jgi:hypothetical protein
MDTNVKSADSVHIEDSASENNIKDAAASPKQRMGDVKLLQTNGETVLVPTPSPDPNGKKDPASRPSKQTRPKTDQHDHHPQTPSTSPLPAKGPS